MHFSKSWLLITSAACLAQVFAQQDYNQGYNNGYDNGGGAAQTSSSSNYQQNNNQNWNGWGQHHRGQNNNQNNTVTVTMTVTSMAAVAASTTTVTVTAVSACGSSVVSDSSSAYMVSAAAASSTTSYAAIREFTTMTDVNFAIGVVTSIPVSIAAQLGLGSTSMMTVSPGSFFTQTTPMTMPAYTTAAGYTAETSMASAFFGGTTLTLNTTLTLGATSIPVGDSKKSAT